jgi:hypothetical protein
VYPVDISGRIYGVVVVHVSSTVESELQAGLRQLLWGVGWLEALFRRRQAEEDAAKIARSAFAMDILASTAHSRRLRSRWSTGSRHD